MTVAHVSSASAEANTVTLGAHSVNDLVIVVAAASPQATISVPAGWYAVACRQNSASLSSIIAFCKAESDSFSVGTWTNATLITADVYSGGAGLSVGGSNHYAGAATTTHYFKELLAQGTSISTGYNVRGAASWIYRAVVVGSNASDAASPTTGFTARQNVQGTTEGEIATFDSAGELASVIQHARTSDTSTPYHTYTIEILESGGVEPVSGDTAKAVRRGIRMGQNGAGLGTAESAPALVAATEHVYPLTDINSLWNDSTASKARTASDGQQIEASRTDDNKEQIFGMDALVLPWSEITGITAELIASADDSPFTLTVRVKVGDTWTSTGTVATGGGSYNTDTAVFSGSWTPGAIQIGVDPGSVDSSDDPILVDRIKITLSGTQTS